MSDTGKIRLFVYGLLKPEYDMPKEATNVQHDAVRGHLWNIHKDAALTDLGNPKAHWSRGYTMMLPPEVLAKIDKSELPEYYRARTITWNGQQTYVYVYNQKLPAHAVSIKSWKLDEKYRGAKAYEKILNQK